MRHLWPKAADAERGFRWELLSTWVKSDPAKEAARVVRAGRRAGQQPLRFAVLGREREPDRPLHPVPSRQLEHRISPLDNTYDNLTVAGDWTIAGSIWAASRRR